ncbi:P-loop containing nucleoside triphosphate hydrolase [Pseudocohnilembus persalinus]|uniref:p-loop containing nucleoside triphosphate hydrolase n=1 Tax=Pseudocohnilembus persalinus TaxID=266149 RepID=A0A0V0R4B8_PSEPJ|nr:P-loop containing nucleoside triphosphate hydrolase [Pseudocohnilembus persalinus]|eukprot:KRX09200.1 P-loop containing nucleoside triphosphate hydrolase [Pseudocohnilembus persalinus]
MSNTNLSKNYQKRMSLNQKNQNESLNYSNNKKRYSVKGNCQKSEQEQQLNENKNKNEMTKRSQNVVQSLNESADKLFLRPENRRFSARGSILSQSNYIEPERQSKQQHSLLNALNLQFSTENNTPRQYRECLSSRERPQRLSINVNLNNLNESSGVRTQPDLPVNFFSSIVNLKDQQLKVQKANKNNEQDQNGVVTNSNIQRQPKFLALSNNVNTFNNEQANGQKQNNLQKENKEDSKRKSLFSKQNQDQKQKNQIHPIEYDHYFDQNKKKRLLKPIWRTFKRDIIKLLIIGALSQITQIANVFYLLQILKTINESLDKSKEEQDDAIQKAIIYAILLIFNMLINVFFSNHTQMEGGLFAIKLKSSLTDKILGMKLTNQQTFHVGKIMNVITYELNAFERNIVTVFESIISPISFIGTGLILFFTFGYTSLVGIIYCLLIVIIGKLFTNYSKKYRRKRTGMVDDRVKQVQEYVEEVRNVKLGSLEDTFTNKVYKQRYKEAKVLKFILVLESFTKALIASSGLIGAFIIFILYTQVSSSDDPLTLSKIILCTYLMSQISLTIQGINNGFVFSCEMKLILGRIISILDNYDLIEQKLEQIKKKFELNDDEQEQQDGLSKKQNVIIFKNFNGYWKNVMQQQTLFNLNCKIKEKQITAIIGKNNSGKSSFVRAILNELPDQDGFLSVKGSISIVEENPTVFSGTLRENIILGQELDLNLYQEVLEACCLNQDIDQFENRDLVEIGERGFNISVGQKTRIALARAIYKQSDIIILEDVLTPLDPKMVKQIYEKAIRGMLKDRTIILTTYRLNVAVQCDYVIVLDQGKILFQDSRENIKKQNINLKNFFVSDKPVQLGQNLLDNRSKAIIYNQMKKPYFPKVQPKKFKVKKNYFTNKILDFTKQKQLEQQAEQKNDQISQAQNQNSMDYQANTLKEFQKIIGTQHIDKKNLNREEDRESQKLDKADLTPSVSSNDSYYSTIQNQYEHSKKNSFQFNLQTQQQREQKQDEFDDYNDKATLKTDNQIIQNVDSPEKQDQIKQSDKQNLAQKISQFNQQYLNPNKLTIIKEISSSQKCISDDNQENQTSIKICNSGLDKSSNNALDSIPEEKSEQNITNQQLNSYDQKITNIQNFPEFFSGPKFQIKTELKNDQQEENQTINQSSPENEDKLMNISNQENSHIQENQGEKGQQCIDLVQHSPAPIFYNNIKQRAEKIKEVQREIIEHYIEPEFVIDEGESEGTETSEENEEEHKSLTRYNMQQQNLQRREKGKTIAQEDASSASPTLKLHKRNRIDCAFYYGDFFFYH